MGHKLISTTRVAMLGINRGHMHLSSQTGIIRSITKHQSCHHGHNSRSSLSSVVGVAKSQSDILGKRLLGAGEGLYTLPLTLSLTMLPSIMVSRDRHSSNSSLPGKLVLVGGTAGLLLSTLALIMAHKVLHSILGRRFMH